VLIKGMYRDRAVPVPVDSSGRLQVAAVEARTFSAYTVAPGAPVTHVMAKGTAATINALPGASGSVLVEYQVTAASAWVAWPPGTATIQTLRAIVSPIYALRFTATVADASIEIAQ
jgi:hypothetical protein